jgi:hypothetical protein
MVFRLEVGQPVFTCDCYLATEFLAQAVVFENVEPPTGFAGELTCGDERCGVGAHLELPFGALFGPLVAGPEGVELTR